MWKRREVERVVERVPSEDLERLSLQLRRLEARVEGLETAPQHPATVARLDAVESRIEPLLGDWALMKTKLTRLFGQITKTLAVDREREPEQVQEGPTNVDEVFNVARQRGIIR